jgi:uncharacterized membrane protein
LAVAGLLFIAVCAASAQDAGEGAQETSELLLFLGRFHPVVLHFPIAMLVVLLLAEIITLGSRSRETSVAKWLMLIVASVTAVTAAAFGWFLSWSGGYDPDLIFWHRWTGVAVAVLAVVAMFLKTQYARLDTARFRVAYWVVLLAAVAVLIPASHYGASITHGTTYLTKYLPPELEFLGPILGQAEIKRPVATGEGYYAAEIQPIFAAKCYECHSAEKQKGDYQLTDPEWMFEGGESGLTAIVPGDALGSNLVNMILLPPEDDDVMPPSGKTPLEPTEIVSIIQWINRGAPMGNYVPPTPEPAEEPDIEVDVTAVVEVESGVIPLVATDELMEVLFEPLIEDLRAALVEEPKGRRALKAVYNPASAIAESHNLLFSRDDEDYMATPEWDALTVAGRDASMALGDAVMAQDYPGARAAFVALVKSCNACHDEFDGSIEDIDDVIPDPEPAAAASDE